MVCSIHPLPSRAQPGRFELHFTPLCRQGPDFSVPCDAAGHVDLDALDERLRNDYFYARVMRGREFAQPHVEAPRPDPHGPPRLAPGAVA